MPPGRAGRIAAGDGWHPAVSCDPSPIACSALRVIGSPPLGGEPAFTNTCLAYGSLSDPIEDLLDEPIAVHDGSLVGTVGWGARPDPDRTRPQSEHPMVPPHPRTGRRHLYVDASFTSRVVQPTRPESDLLLGLFFHHVERNLARQIGNEWHPNSPLVWDNWANQNHAVWGHYPLERLDATPLPMIAEVPIPEALPGFTRD